VAVRNGGVAVRNGGVAVRNGDVAVRNGGVAVLKGGLADRNGRVAVRNGGVAGEIEGSGTDHAPCQAKSPTFIDSRALVWCKFVQQVVLRRGSSVES